MLWCVRPLRRHGALSSVRQSVLRSEAAEMARELDGLSLTDALDLALLIRDADRRRYEQAV
jgi:hypothetical protein